MEPDLAAPSVEGKLISLPFGGTRLVSMRLMMLSCLTGRTSLKASDAPSWRRLAARKKDTVCSLSPARPEGARILKYSFRASLSGRTASRLSLSLPEGWKIRPSVLASATALPPLPSTTRAMPPASISSPGRTKRGRASWTSTGRRTARVERAMPKRS